MRIKYVIYFICASGAYYTPQEWRIKKSGYSPGFGQPTDQNIKKWVQSFEESMKSGPNKHLGFDKVMSARIINQEDGKVVASWVSD